MRSGKSTLATLTLMAAALSNGDMMAMPQDEFKPVAYSNRVLTPKQIKGRAASKRARLARKLQRQK